jgi:nicotinamidase-related amidase
MKAVDLTDDDLESALAPLGDPTMRSACALVTCAFLLGAAGAQNAEQPALIVTMRQQVPQGDRAVEVTRKVRWQTKETAIIVCDVWDAHHCLNAVRRLEEMLPRMNRVVEKARGQGVLIIHAPSSCMDAYKNHPARKRAQDAPAAKNLPKDIDKWCHKIPAEEKGVYPIDQSKGGEDDDPAEHAEWHAKLKAMGRNPKAPWKSQHAGIKIHDQDIISDSGVEIWNVLEARGIKNVILVGVHTNMCVLGRPFGLLMRDMTDTMYDPKAAPYVSHFEGTRLIVAHIERYVCPTITSDQIIGGERFRFKGDTGK